MTITLEQQIELLEGRQGVTRCKDNQIDEAILASLRRLQEIEKEGCQLVPAEPTNKMIKEAWAMLENNILPLSQRDKIICAYKAMLAASEISNGEPSHYQV